MRRAFQIQPRKSPRQAFTLVEVMVVVALLSMAVTLVVTKLDGLSRNGRLESSARQLAAWFDLARVDARTTGTPRRLVYATTSNRLTIQRGVLENQDWVWGQDQVFPLGDGVTLERVFREGAELNPEPDADRKVTVRIDGSGGFRSFAVVLEVADTWIIVDHSDPSGTRVVRPNRRPTSMTYELLLMELAHGEPGSDTH